MIKIIPVRKSCKNNIDDTTIINAPSSIENQDKARDPEMVNGDESEPRTTKKGNQWYFGVKAHIGVDSKTKLIHSIVATPANEHDKHALPQLLHGNERRVYGDSAYSSQKGCRNKALTCCYHQHSIIISAPSWGELFCTKQGAVIN